MTTELVAHPNHKDTDINRKKCNLTLLVDMFTQFYSKLCILEWENLKNPI